jgi:energy-converting hydrogenase Eha subunit H
LGITELVSNSVETRRLEAQAEADQERARLVDAQNERLRTLPLVLASSADTGLSVIYAMFDRLALVVLGLLYLRERGKHHDNNMSSLR